MDQRIINLYDNFTHSRISRREFMDELTKIAGSAAAAAAILPLLKNDYAVAATVPENDARLNAQKVSYDSLKGKISGYLVRAIEPDGVQVERDGQRLTVEPSAADLHRLEQAR